MSASNIRPPTTIPPNWNEQAHVVQFYTDDSFLVEGLAEFFGTALARGESAIVLATPEHLDGLNEQLMARGISVAKVIQQGRYIALDAAEMLAKIMGPTMPDERRFESAVSGLIRRAEAAAHTKHKRVAVFGELVALLCAGNNFKAALRLEQLWNELARTQFFQLRCAYPISGFQGELKGEPYATICAEHSLIIPADPGYPN